MNTLYFLLFHCCIYIGSATLLIKELKVPDSIKSGSMDEVVLDCDYVATPDETNIVLKWFYNGEIQQIYQWIPESGSHGYASGKLKDNIDLGYKASNDKNFMYRALRIKDITPDMSGNYTCKVSSDENEVKETKQLIIYTPAQEDLQLILFEDLSQVLCAATGIYPKPVIDLYADSGNETIDYEVNENAEFDENGLYNITTILSYDTNNLTDSLKFTCDLSIPGTNYSLTEQVELLIVNENAFGREFLYPLEFEEDYNITNEVLRNDSIVETENSGVQNSYIITSLLITLLFVLFFVK